MVRGCHVSADRFGPASGDETRWDRRRPSPSNDWKDVQGTGGFYFHEVIDTDDTPSDKVLLVTNHYVVCEIENKKYDYRGTSLLHPKIRICGPRRFQRGLDEINSATISEGIDATEVGESIKEPNAQRERGDWTEADAKELRKYLAKLDEHEAAMLELGKLYSELTTNWADITRPTIGALEYPSPPSRLT